METVERKFQIDVAPLRNNNLFLATPAYGGNVHANYNHSMLGLQSLLMQCGIPHQIRNMSNESLITRARNRFAAQFLQTDCTHLMFIDSDIAFDPQDVCGLLHFQKDIIGGQYPMKGINWPAIKEIVKKNPEVSLEDLELCAGQFTGHFIGGENKVYPFEPMEVKNLATGFTMFSRNVIETLKADAPRYLRADNEPKDLPNEMHDIFQVGVNGNDYESEDYSVTRKWREKGGKVFSCPWMKLTHYGTYGFKGDLNRVIELLGTV